MATVVRINFVLEGRNVGKEKGWEGERTEKNRNKNDSTIIVVEVIVMYGDAKSTDDSSTDKVN